MPNITKIRPSSLPKAVMNWTYPIRYKEVFFSVYLAWSIHQRCQGWKQPAYISWQPPAIFFSPFIYLYIFWQCFSGASTPEGLSRWKGCCTTRLSRGLDTCSEANMSLTQPANRRLSGNEEGMRTWLISMVKGFHSAYTYTGGRGVLSVCSINTETERGCPPGGHI